MLKRTLLITFIIITASAELTAMNTKAEKHENYSDIEYRLESAIHAFYQSHWEDAEAILDELTSSDPNDLRPYFFEAMLPFWKYFFAGEEPEVAQRFLEKSQKAVRIGNEYLDQHPNDTTVVLMMGGLYGYRGLVAASEKQYRTALQSGANGFSFTRKLMSMDSSHPDALIGQGVFNYMVGNIPREAKWLTSFAGLNGDKATGFEKLEEASQKSTHTSTDARMILTYLYQREERYDDALRVVSSLVEQWPDNIIFRYYYAKSLEYNNKYDQAREAYRMVAESGQKHLDLIQQRSAEKVDQLAQK